MVLENQELGAAAQGTDSVDTLVREHRMLDEKVAELSERSFLTTEDRMELARLKKEKLKMKDRIAELSAEQKSA